MADDIVRLGIEVDSTSVKKADKDLDNFTRTSKKTEDGVKSLSNAFSNSLRGAVAGISFGYVAKDILDTNRQMEMLRASLTSVTGSIESGKDAFEFVQKFARDTPFEVEDLTKAFITLKNFGIQPTSQIMQAISDQASKLGASTDTLNGIVLQLGQAWAKGRLQGQELLSLAERGVPVYDLLAKVTGKTTAEISKMAEKGEITRDVIEKLIKAMGEESVGSSVRAMNTLGGSISNLSDAWKTFEDTLLNDKGEGLIKNFIASVTREINLFTRYLSNDVGDQIKVLEDRIANFKEGGSLAKFVGDYTGYDVNLDKERLVRLKRQKELEDQAKQERQVEEQRVADQKAAADAKAATAAEELKKREEYAKKQLEINKRIAQSWKDLDADIMQSMDDMNRAIFEDTAQERKRLEEKFNPVTTQFGSSIGDIQDYYKTGGFGAVGSSGAISRMKTELDDLGKKFNETNDNIKQTEDQMSEYAIQASRNMQSAFADFLFDPFAKGTQSMGDAFATMLRRMAAQAAASKIMDLLNPLIGAGMSAVGGWAKGLFSSGFSPTTVTPQSVSLQSFSAIRTPTFASGGDFGGGLRLVGENGPELEATGASRIFNAQQTREMLNGGGQRVNNIVVNVTNDGKQSADQMGDQIAKSIIRTIAREEIASATRPGNQLNRGRAF